MLIASGLAVAVVFLAGESPKPAAEKPKLIVLDLTAAGVDPQAAAALSEAVTAEVASRGFFSVISSREVRTLVGLERQKQMLGACSEQGSCLTELAGAIGARFVLSGTLAKLGDAFQLSLQTIDSAKATPIGRSVRLANDFATLRAQLPFAVAEATGLPLPPPPSRVLPYSMVAGGSALFVGGGVVGIAALTLQSVLAQELAANNPSYNFLAEYRARRANIDALKIASAVALAVGAAVAGAGIYLNPPEQQVRGQAKLVLLPSSSGVLAAWDFP